MNKGMKKTVAAVIAVSLVLTGAVSMMGCAGSESADIETAGKPPVSGKESPVQNMDDADQDVLKTININISDDYRSYGDDEAGLSTLYTVYCDAAYVMDNGYDKLQDTLNDVFNDEVKSIETAVSNAKEDIKSNGVNDYERVPSIEKVCELKRSDSMLVSIVFYNYLNLGGAHPVSFRSSANINPADGKLLNTADIITDKKAFKKAALSALDKIADEQGFDDDYAQQFDRAVETSYDELTIYTDNQNLYLYFPTYTFGVYAAGDAEIAIPLSECTSFMGKRYIYPSQARVIKLDNGEPDFIYIYSDEDEINHDYTYSDGQVNFTLEYRYNYADVAGSMKITSENKAISKEIDATVDDVYVVKTDDGRAFAYISMSYLDASKYMEVYDIDGEPELKGSVDASFAREYCSPLPDDMVLYTYIHKLGTYNAFKRYYVDTSGVPITNEDEFKFTNPYDEDSYGYSLTSIAELSLDIDGKQENFPVASQFIPVATDDYSYFKMKLEDGRIGKLAVKKNEEDGSFLVKDALGRYADENDCFEQLFYTG